MTENFDENMSGNAPQQNGQMNMNYGAYNPQPNNGQMNMNYGAYNPQPNNGQPNNGQPNMNYGAYNPQPKEKGDGRGLGIASMVLGIISLLMFCTCTNWITGILAIIFGIVQLVKHKEKGFAITGIITAGLSLLLAICLYVSFLVAMGDMDYEEFYDSYYEEYYGDYYE